MATPELDAFGSIVEHHKTDTQQAALLGELERSRLDVLAATDMASARIKSGMAHIEKPVTIYSRPDLWEWQYTVVVCPNGDVETRSFCDTGCDWREGEILKRRAPYTPPTVEEVLKNDRMRTEYRDVIQGLAKLLEQDVTRPA